MSNGIIIVGVENALQSIIRDTYSAITIIGIIGVGVYLESSAMQWVGFLMVIFMALVKVIGHGKKNTYAGQDAIDRVAELVEKCEKHGVEK